MQSTGCVIISTSADQMNPDSRVPNKEEPYEPNIEKYH